MTFGTLGQWYLPKRTVSREFREILVRELPGLGQDQRLWTLLEYLIFPAYRDDETDATCVPAELIKQIGNTATAKEFLDECSTSIAHIILGPEGWSYANRRCRTVSAVQWPPAVAAAIPAELQRQWRADERVYLRTGGRATAKAWREQREELQTLVAAVAQRVTVEQQVVMNYLHALAPNQFTQMVQANLAKAYELIAKFETPEAQLFSYRALLAVCESTKPYYRPSHAGRTVRIFPVGNSLANIPSVLRRVLLPEWYELDLKCAQFAVAAMLWRLDAITAFLQGGGDVWEELAAHVGSGANKKLLKARVYAIINGGGKRKVKRALDQQIGPGAGARLFSHRFMCELWEARNNAMEAVKRDGGAVDAFGRWIPLAETWAGSVIAQQAQSYELKLLLPVYELANSTERFSVMLHQHDGLTVDIQDSRRVKGCLKEIKGAVKDQADALGILTSLT